MEMCLARLQGEQAEPNELRVHKLRDISQFVGSTARLGKHKQGETK